MRDESEHAVTRSARAWVRGRGLPLAKRPSHAPPPVPANFANIPPDDLGELLGAYAAWHAYASSVLGEAEVNMLATSLESRNVLADALDSICGSEPKLTQKRAAARARKLAHVEAVELAALVAEARATMVKRQFYAYESIYKALSRELTRREQSLARGT